MAPIVSAAIGTNKYDRDGDEYLLVFLSAPVYYDVQQISL